MKINFNNKDITLEIQQEHYIRRLGFPSDYELPSHMEEMMDSTAKWYEENGQPWLGIYEADVVLDNNKASINGYIVDSEKVYKRFSKHNVQKTMIILATAGEKSDLRIKELWDEAPDQSFFLDAYTASVTESIVKYAVDYIKKWAIQKGLYSLSRYSPGYIGWNLTQQKILMDIIADQDKDLPVSLTDSALLYPLKSQISIVGLHHNPDKKESINVSCTTCSFMKCSCREKHLLET